MTIDFQKLGLDKIATGIGKSVGGRSGGTNTLVTGDITRGNVVTVSLDGASPSTGTATVSGRRTGAMYLGQDVLDTPNLEGTTWTISGTTLTVQSTDTSTSTLSFWVF